VTVGLLLAFEVLGASIGSLVFGRAVSPARRLRVMGPLAVAACAVLMLFALSPPLLPALLILAASGVFTCFQLAANAAFVRAAPAEQRSQAFGLAVGGMSLGQGLVMILAGAAAEHYAPSAVIAVAGGLGALTAPVLAISWHASISRHDPQPRQDRGLRQRRELRASSCCSGPVAGTHVAVLSGWRGAGRSDGSGPVAGTHEGCPSGWRGAGEGGGVGSGPVAGTDEGFPSGWRGTGVGVRVGSGPVAGTHEGCPSGWRGTGVGVRVGSGPVAGTHEGRPSGWRGTGVMRTG